MSGPVWRLARRSELAWRIRDFRSGRPAGPAPASGSLRPVVHPPTFLRWDHMPQRPHAMLTAFADAGHPAHFVQRGGRRTRTERGVVVEPSLRAVPSSGTLVYIHFAPTHLVLSRFESPVVVYDVLDDLSIYEPGEAGLPTRRTVAANHLELLRAADLVLASSPTLAERVAGVRDDVLVVPNGVDPTRFTGEHSRPEDVPSDGPVIGFIGALERWVDIDLLETLASARPGWRLVLVGPVGADVASAVGRLSELPNVFVLGARPFDEIPAYAASFDVGIVPFVVDGLTEAVSPLKMYEYLAAGVGVVSTALPAARGVAEVDVADDREGFLTAIERRLGLDPGRVADAARREAAAVSWGVRIAPILDRLDATSSRRVP